jgi:methylenetetrahydrofolate dehydrogenase (NADP+)/methenyltetrahydrofolate cyclohydrolase
VTATLIDGRAAAERLRRRIADRTNELAKAGLVPGLAVVLVAATTSTNELIALIRRLNADVDVHGILVQLPLPAGVDSAAVLAAVDPAKDVDGFHAVNAGKLALGEDGIVPCTPLGCLILLRDVVPNMAGKRALVIGRSNIVGKPMAQLLLQNDCTVTIAHSRTKDLASICAASDIVVAAIGRPKAIPGEWLKPGAVVIDVGINRVMIEGKSKVVGDVDFASAVERAGAITPVPGGVGPMTIACLLLNTVNAAIRSRGGTDVLKA